MQDKVKDSKGCQELSLVYHPEQRKEGIWVWASKGEGNTREGEKRKHLVSRGCRAGHYVSQVKMLSLLVALFLV